MAGWGMAPKPFKKIPSGSADVLMVYDYRSLDDWDIVEFLHKNQQKKVHLLAWSMGVWVTAGLLRHDKHSRSSLASITAIGGTCRPIHDRLGIPEQAFDLTLQYLSPVLLETFYRSMFDNNREAELFLRHLRKTQRSAEELKEELAALCTACKADPDVSDIFRKRIVTGRDQIFPPRNQLRAWGHQDCTSLSLPHFPFYQWASWAEMLRDFS